MSNLDMIKIAERFAELNEEGLEKATGGKATGGLRSREGSHPTISEIVVSKYMDRAAP